MMRGTCTTLLLWWAVSMAAAADGPGLHLPITNAALHPKDQPGATTATAAEQSGNDKVPVHDTHGHPKHPKRGLAKHPKRQRGRVAQRQAKSARGDRARDEDEVAMRLFESRQIARFKALDALEAHRIDSWAYWLLDAIPAKLSEVCWITGTGRLLLHLRRCSSEDALKLSLQMAITSAIVFCCRPYSRWRGELGYVGDLALGGMSVLICLKLLLEVRRAGKLQPGFGEELLQKWLPNRTIAAHIASWFGFYTIAGIFSFISVQCILPEDVLDDDRRFGLSPYVGSMHEALDCLAILPQFYLFTKDRQVPLVLADWVLSIFTARCLSFISGFTSVYQQYSYFGEWSHTQICFMSSQMFNMAVLSDFVFHYFRAHKRQNGAFELPV